MRIDVALLDKEILRWFDAQPGTDVHVVCRRLAVEVGCSESTIYRAMSRLIAARRLERLQGNTRTGYTYRVISE